MNPLKTALLFALVLVFYLSSLKLFSVTKISWKKIFSPIWLPLAIFEVIAIVYVLIQFLSGDLK